ncbi:MAG TPA: hypothetical protein PKA61_13270 [Nitrospira sp.]|nr:hypothetical protein [Nitrospira sp.]
MKDVTGTGAGTAQTVPTKEYSHTCRNASRLLRFRANERRRIALEPNGVSFSRAYPYRPFYRMTASCAGSRKAV